jgi:uncharacterized SAM-binding protein YcdF (DUF218 family)
VFYLASKIFWIFASPIDSLLIAALVGVLLTSTRFARTGRAVAGLAILLLIAAATPPLGYLLIAPLEDRFPPPSPDMAPPDGIIILGGAVNGEVGQARGQTVFGEGERMTEAVLLAQRYPKASIIFTGGNGLLALEASTEAPEAKRFFTQFGVDPARITLERKSLNTDENARFTAKLLHPGRAQRWLLVTSAYHMSRSMGLFEKAGFNVIAYPVAYRTTGAGEHHQLDFDPARNLRTFELAMHEWIGLVAYWATGRIHHLFPGPTESIA